MTRTLIKCNDNFIEQIIDNELVLLDLETADFFSLSGSALSVWNLLDGSRDGDAIISELAEEYGGDRQEIGKDVARFIEQLIAISFVRYA